LIQILKGIHPEQCGMNGRCSLQCVVEADGSIYPCDFYVLDEFRQGNIHKKSLDDILKAKNTIEFLNNQVPQNCLCKSCKVYHLCGGGCQRYRNFYSEIENYCPYQDFLYYAYNSLHEIAARL
jgi:uncharacterized protein